MQVAIGHCPRDRVPDFTTHAGISLITSVAFLSLRMPRKTGWRISPLVVHSVNFTSPTSLGDGHTQSRGGCAPISAMAAGAAGPMHRRLRLFAARGRGSRQASIRPVEVTCAL